MTSMNKGEREDLQRLTRQREKLLKDAAKQRSAEIMADFENQMSASYSFDDDVVWEAAAKAAKLEIEKAQASIAARCVELGIPKQFAPNLHVTWRNRGYDNLVEKRRNELRRAAQAQVAALERRAIVEIGLASVSAQTELAVAGLSSDAARAFVERLPTVENLMPAISYAEISGETDPPVVEQLLKPNGLRHRDQPKSLQ